MNFFSKLVLPVAVLSVAACGSMKKSEEAAKTATEVGGVTTDKVESSAASAVGATYFVDIEFPRGSKMLRESAKGELDSLIQRAQNDGKIKEVTVISWADQEYPSDAKKNLNKGQRDLASARSKAIEKHIKTNRTVDVDTYNMAEQPSKLEKWMNTSDAKVKETMAAAGLPTTAGGNKLTGKASHAIVMVVVE